MKIDHMQPKDLPRVTELAAELGYPFTLEEIQKRFEDVCGALFVARIEDQAVGWIHIVEETPTLLADHRAEILALVVDSKVRGKGIGKALLARAEDWARKHDLPLIRLRSNIKREEAHSFYMKHGYETFKTSLQLTKLLS